jgi:hypothetical protein
VHWPAGTGLDAHDHGGSTGAFAVVAGHLEEARITADGTTSARRVGPGETSAFGAATIHAVANRSPRSATSVHVYSPPLGEMSFYAPGADGRPVARPAAGNGT